MDIVGVLLLCLVLLIAGVALYFLYHRAYAEFSLALREVNRKSIARRRADRDEMIRIIARIVEVEAKTATMERSGTPSITSPFAVREQRHVDEINRKLKGEPIEIK